MKHIKDDLITELSTLSHAELDEIYKRLAADVKYERKTAQWSLLYVTVLVLSMLMSIYHLCG